MSGLVAYRARVVEEKRSAILDAAVSKFLEAGYDRTSLETIAKAAGVSTGTLFKHFPSKAALFGGIMARMWENDGEAPPPMPPAGEPKSGLLAIGRAYAALLAEQSTVDLFRIVTAEAPRFPEIGRELYERGKAPYLDRLYAYLSAECEAGHLNIPNVPLAARQFLGMINDVVFWPRFLVVDLQLSPVEIDEVVIEAVATMMARYAAQPG